ncbi:hypothetical protein PSPO01_13910 [Paraphaeosphaeria sporulosa]
MENYRILAIANVDLLATPKWGRPPISAILEEWDTAIQDHGTQDAFREIRTSAAQKVVFGSLAKSSPLYSLLQRLRRCDWKLETEDLGDQFGYTSLVDPKFVRYLARISAYAADISWATVVAAVQQARNGRLSSVNGRSGPHGQDWLPQDVMNAEKTLGLRRARKAAKCRHRTIHRQTDDRFPLPSVSTSRAAGEPSQHLPIRLASGGGPAPVVPGSSRADPRLGEGQTSSSLPSKDSSRAAALRPYSTRRMLCSGTPTPASPRIPRAPRKRTVLGELRI